MDKFVDRVAAGMALAKVLAAKTYDRPVVLALPRGGVPVALEVAKALNAPLDLVMVRKIGVPNQPELAAAAVVIGDTPQIVINENIVAHVGIDQTELDHLAKAQLDEIKRRRQVYLKDRASVPVAGRTAIIVDDGIATGATVRAALQAVRRQNPLRLILAVPVAPADALAQLRAKVDEIVCLTVPAQFYAIGAHYVDFAQVSDAEVVAQLAKASRLPVRDTPQIPTDSEPG